MAYKIVKLDNENRTELSNLIKEMESDIYYPLGDDFFRIDHGYDYFAFFERLGELHYWCAFDGDKLIGVAAGILRTINDEKTWYLCDLKVIKEYRGKGVPRAIFKKAFFYNFKNHKVFKAYAVSMNSNDNKDRFKAIRRSTFGLLKKNKLLKIYSLSKNEYLSICGKFTYHRIVHTQKKKDLILKSSKRKLSLFHYNRKRLDESARYIEPSEDSIIMISAIEGSDMDILLTKEGFKSDSDATVLSFRMKGDFEIFTDEI